MTPELLKWAASLGVGGVLAAGMFYMYRKDMRDAQARLTLAQQNTVTLANRILDAVATLAAHTALLDRIGTRLDADDAARHKAAPGA